MVVKGALPYNRQRESTADNERRKGGNKKFNALLGACPSKTKIIKCIVRFLRFLQRCCRGHDGPEDVRGGDLAAPAAQRDLHLAQAEQHHPPRLHRQERARGRNRRLLPANQHR